MTRAQSSEQPLQQVADKLKPEGKIVISSIVTHADILNMIKERHPVIARRDKPKN